MCISILNKVLASPFMPIVKFRTTGNKQELFVRGKLNLSLSPMVGHNAPPEHRLRVSYPAAEMNNSRQRKV